MNERDIRNAHRSAWYWWTSGFIAGAASGVIAVLVAIHV